MEEFSILKENNMNIYRCDICNSPEELLLCNNCFDSYNKKFEDNLKGFTTTRDELSKQITILLSYNLAKSKRLNKAIIMNKYKQTLESLINQEKSKLDKCQKESKEYDDLLIKQKEINSRLKSILNDLEKGESIDEPQNDSIFESEINLTKFIVDNKNSNNDNISNLKKQIFEMNNKIRKVKKEYIYDLFEKLFIKKKSIIKISDFFKNTQYQENNMNFSIIKINNSSNSDNKDFENDISINKEINIDLLKENDIYLKRFSSFIKSMFSFLEKCYKKFQLKMPFKTNNYKIAYKNEFEYNCDINESKIKDLSQINSIIKGLHLLNINYIYLMQYIFGDTIKLNEWFDISFFLISQADDVGSLEKILEDAKNGDVEEVFEGFLVY